MIFFCGVLPGTWFTFLVYFQVLEFFPWSISRYLIFFHGVLPCTCFSFMENFQVLDFLFFSWRTSRYFVFFHGVLTSTWFFSWSTAYETNKNRTNSVLWEKLIKLLCNIFLAPAPYSAAFLFQIIFDTIVNVLIVPNACMLVKYIRTHKLGGYLNIWNSRPMHNVCTESKA